VVEKIDTDLKALVETLPPHVQGPLRDRNDTADLLEVVLDLGREPEVRFLNESFLIDSQEVTDEDIQYVLERIGPFGGDNRAGIERTLHRISAIRNRKEKVVGLTLRVGRAVHGTIRIIEDLVVTGKSILLVGRPGVGKTTMLREVARVLSDDAHKRTIVVDTSNEIGGDGDIAHPGIGRARRMQVSAPARQHAVMIEAVENHMPEVIVIDEIGTELEANAARTIAERGVQLVATAHGNTLENLIMNPTLSDLVGGVHSVTLGDDEARRRRTQKTVLERAGPPTFEILVEIQGWDRVAIHPDVADTVDKVLRGFRTTPETRTVDGEGGVRRVTPTSIAAVDSRNGGSVEDPKHSYPERVEPERPDLEPPSKPTRILPYGVNKGKLQQAARGATEKVEVVSDIHSADLLVTTKSYYKRKTQTLRTAEHEGKPVYVLRKNTLTQMEQFIKAITRSQGQGRGGRSAGVAIREAEEAAARIGRGENRIDLNPQGAYVRHLQHQIADNYGLSSASFGREPGRRVVIYRR
jgi:stage III sporulation protein SpoIIIAA